MNRCGKMRMAQLRKLYKDLGRGIKCDHHLSDSHCESVEETLYNEVFFALFWSTILPLHRCIEDFWNQDGQMDLEIIA